MNKEKKAIVKQFLNYNPPSRSTYAIVEYIDKIRSRDKLEQIKKILTNYKKITLTEMKKKINPQAIVQTKLAGKFKNLLDGWILLANLRGKTKYAEVRIYGTRYRDGYKPDDTYKLIYRHSLNPFKINLNESKKVIEQKYKDKIYKIFLDDQQDYNSIVTGTIQAINNIKPKKYEHHFKTGSFNCLLQQMSDHYQDKLTQNRIKNLNSQYYQSGITYNDIKKVCDRIHCGIEIYDILNNLIFKYDYDDNKRKVFKYTITSLDHVEKKLELLHDMSNKKLKYIDNLQEAYEMNKYNSKIQVVKRGMNREVQYYYDEENIYKSKDWIDDDYKQYYITDDFTLEKYLFEKNNNLQFNRLYKTHDYFNFITESNQYVNEFYFLKNCSISKNSYQSSLDYGLVDNDKLDMYEINLDDVYAYDMNKNYMSYKTLDIYQKFLFPSTGKFDYYSITDEISIDLLLQKTGFIQITNLIYPNNNLGMILKELNYFRNDYVYPTPMIQFLYDNKIKFKPTAIAFTNHKEKINFSDNIIDNKFYNYIIGMMRPSEDFIKKTMRFNDKRFLQDILFYNNHDIQITPENEFICKMECKNFSNQAHISSYILAYSILPILEKLKNINYDDIVGIKVDCIMTKKDYSHLFNFDNKVGSWKLENKSNKIFQYIPEIINPKSSIKYDTWLPLTDDKIRYNKLNLIYGAAGTGKTTRWYKTFNTDERINNFKITSPNNELRLKFTDIEALTYHKLFGIGCEPSKELYHLTNVILDEVTMIPCDILEKIIKTSDEHKINLYLVGDYNPDNNQIYQLKPVMGESLIKCNFDNNITYKKHLNFIYRSENDHSHRASCNRIRGLSNSQAKATLDNDNYKKIKLDEIKNYFVIDKDIALASTNEMRKKINDMLLPLEEDYINIKFGSDEFKKKSSFKYEDKYYYRNQKLRIPKSKFNPKIMDYSYCITNHLCQGQEYDEPSKVFIIMDRFFEDNMIYVCLTRAKSKSQVILVYPDSLPTGKSFNDIIIKKLRAYKKHDKQNNREFDLNLEDVLEIYEKFKGHCKYCNTKVITENYEPFCKRQFSIDRKDNKIGHIRTNCVLSCLSCNNYGSNIKSKHI